MYFVQNSEWVLQLRDGIVNLLLLNFIFLSKIYIISRWTNALPKSKYNNQSLGLYNSYYREDSRNTISRSIQLRMSKGMELLPYSKISYRWLYASVKVLLFGSVCCWFTYHCIKRQIGFERYHVVQEIVFVKCHFLHIS